VSRREVLVIAHTGRPAARKGAEVVVNQLTAAGIGVRLLDDEAGQFARDGAEVVPADESAADGVELGIVLGGDGTLLRGAELVRPSDTPLLGVNVGHFGFLADTEPDALEATVDHVIRRDYRVEERMTVDVTVRLRGEVIYEGWALNEVALEKADRARLLECVVEVEGRPLSRWGCDGVLCSTPTGSTAYAFSVGGPILWPGVEALLVAPISAHALFARPLVLAPQTAVAVEVLPGETAAVLSCDGRRSVKVPTSARMEVSRGRKPVRLAIVHPRTFTDRLVRKFDLPIQGWRGRPGC
jgi:NAD+ kinase